jgi:hypothetical protein
MISVYHLTDGIARDYQNNPGRQINKTSPDPVNVKPLGEVMHKKQKPQSEDRGF